MDGMDELRSPSLPTSPAAPIIVFPLPSMLSVLQLLGTIRCPKKPRAAHTGVGSACAVASGWTPTLMRPVREFVARIGWLACREIEGPVGNPAGLIIAE